MDRAKFGPGGNGDLFYAEGGKGTVDAPRWVSGFGLDAYEFEAGNGISAGEETLRKIGERASEYNISMSLHTVQPVQNSCSHTETLQTSMLTILLQSSVAGMVRAHQTECLALQIRTSTMQSSLTSSSRTEAISV